MPERPAPLRLGGTRVVAALTGADGQALTLTVSMRIDATDTAMTGTVVAAAG